MDRRQVTGFAVLAAVVVLIAGTDVWWGLRTRAAGNAVHAGDAALDTIRLPADFRLYETLHTTVDGSLGWMRDYTVANPDPDAALAEYQKALTEAGAIAGDPAVCDGCGRDMCSGITVYMGER